MERVKANILDNPFNYEKDYFLDICKTRISYTKNMSDEFLTKLYYYSETQQYKYED